MVVLNETYFTKYFKGKLQYRVMLCKLFCWVCQWNSASPSNTKISWQMASLERQTGQLI